MNPKKLITNIIAFAAFLCTLWFLVLPQWDAVKLARSEIGPKQSKVEEERETLKKINEAGAVLESKKDDVERVEKAIPQKELKPELISVLEDFANQNGLVLLSLGIESSGAVNANAPVLANDPNQPSSPKDKLDELKLNLHLSGTYSSFKNWLQEIETSLRVTDVGSINFSVERGEEGDGEDDAGDINPADPVISFNVTMNTYKMDNIK